MPRDKAKELARYARYRKKRTKEKNAAHSRASYHRHRHQINERRRERSWRLAAGRKEIEHGLALAELSELDLRSPRFTLIN